MQHHKLWTTNKLDNLDVGKLTGPPKNRGPGNAVWSQ